MHVGEQVEAVVQQARPDYLVLSAGKGWAGHKPCGVHVTYWSDYHHGNHYYHYPMVVIILIVMMIVRQVSNGDGPL
jgi:hypothetical protein